MSLFRFINAQKANYSVSLLCRVVEVSRWGYYRWRERPQSRRSVEDSVLTARIWEIHECSRHTYGYPRVHAELNASGLRCGRRRVARLMREAGLSGCMRGTRRRKNTRRDKDAVPAPELVDRHFLAVTDALEMALCRGRPLVEAGLFPRWRGRDRPWTTPWPNRLFRR